MFATSHWRAEDPSQPGSVPLCTAKLPTSSPSGHIHLCPTKSDLTSSCAPGRSAAWATLSCCPLPDRSADLLLRGTSLGQVKMSNQDHSHTPPPRIRHLNKAIREAQRLATLPDFPQLVTCVPHRTSRRKCGL
ncbi:hypothetical protein LEMLEM_LOCUS18836 [Lemmus lemmus]